MRHRKNTKPVAVVTGGSSGIGKYTAEALAAAGYRIYNFSRHNAGTAGACHIQTD